MGKHVSGKIRDFDTADGRMERRGVCNRTATPPTSVEPANAAAAEGFSKPREKKRRRAVGLRFLASDRGP